MSPNAVDVAMHRAVERLRQALDGSDEPGDPLVLVRAGPFGIAVRQMCRNRVLAHADRDGVLGVPGRDVADQHLLAVLIAARAAVLRTRPERVARVVRKMVGHGAVADRDRLRVVGVPRRDVADSRLPLALRARLRGDVGLGAGVARLVAVVAIGAVVGLVAVVARVGVVALSRPCCRCRPCCSAGRRSAGP